MTDPACFAISIMYTASTAPCTQHSITLQNSPYSNGRRGVSQPSSAYTDDRESAYVPEYHTGRRYSTVEGNVSDATNAEVLLTTVTRFQSKFFFAEYADEEVALQQPVRAERGDASDERARLPATAAAYLR